MKVDGPSSSGKTGQAKKTSKAGASKGAGFSSALRGSSSEEEPVEETSGLAGGATLGSIDALLALQGVDAVDATNPDGKGKNRAAVERGESLLKELDAIRIGLLTGSLSVHQLTQLQNKLATRTETISDPTLKTVLDDIELRVAVELAKHALRD